MSMLKVFDGTKWVLVPVAAPTLVAGQGITIDNTNPLRPVIGLATADTLPTVINPKDDEFNDTAGMSGLVNGLNAKWALKNVNPTWLSFLTENLKFTLPSAQSATQAIYQPAPTGDFRISAATTLVSAGDRQMWGLFVVDANGTGISLMLDDPAGDGATRLRTPSGWNLSNGTIGQPVSSNLNNAWVNGQKIYLSLRKSDNTYYGAAWNEPRTAVDYAIENSVIPTAFVPAYIGFGRGFGVGASQVKLDWLRVS